jgi:hypothetical protein
MKAVLTVLIIAIALVGVLGLVLPSVSTSAEAFSSGTPWIHSVQPPAAPHIACSFPPCDCDGCG